MPPALKKLSRNMGFLELPAQLRFTSLDSHLLLLKSLYAPLGLCTLVMPGIAVPRPPLGHSQLGIAAALPLRTAPILERCPGMATSV